VSEQDKLIEELQVKLSHAEKTREILEKSRDVEIKKNNKLQTQLKNM
jgi:hypothetical protein